MKGSVKAWETIWRATAPGMVSRVIQESIERQEDVACLAGLVRSVTRPASEPHAAREPVPYGEFPEGF